MEFDAVLLQPRRAREHRPGPVARPHDQRRARRLRRRLPRQAGADRGAGRDRRGPPLHLPRTRDAWPTASPWAWRAWASAATTWSRCSCRTGGSSRVMLPGLLAHRRGAQPADAHLPRARAVVHAQARRGQGRDRAQAVPRLRPRADARGRCSPACRACSSIVVVGGGGAEQLRRAAERPRAGSMSADAQRHPRRATGRARTT